MHSTPVAREDAGGLPQADAAPRQDPEPRAPWAPPLPVEAPELGPQGAYCHPYPGQVTGVDLWADARGPFVSVDTVNDAGSTAHWPSGASLQHHDGTDWGTWLLRPHSVEDPGPARVRGSALGVLTWQDGDCWLRALQGPEDEACLYGDPPERTPTLVDATILSEDRRWLLMTDGSTVRLSGGSEPIWGSELSGSGTPLAVWADMVIVYTLTSSSFGDGTPHGPYTDLWIRNQDDIWISTSDGRLLHYDVVQWRTYTLPVATISHVWGNAEGIYFAAPRAFGYLSRDGQAEVLLSWSDPELTLEALHGHGNDVYLAFHDERHARTECGPIFVVHYDGERYRQL
jgi:hypothetical protein